MSSANWDEARIETRSLDTGETRLLIRGGSDARYVPTGHLVYAVADTLLAVPFDADTLEVRGGPVPVAGGVARSYGGTAAAHTSFSKTGSLAFVTQDQIAVRTVVWANRSGRRGEALVEPGHYRTVMSSPDGGRLAFVRGNAPPNIWILDLRRTTLTRLTTETATDPVWSPDGEWLAFRSEGRLYRKRSDFSGAAEPLFEKSANLLPYAYSHDGKWLVYGERDGVQSDLWALPLQEDGEPQPLVRSQFNERNATLSSDGRYLVYQSNESGRNEVYVTPFPDPGRKWQISTGGGETPLWSPDGRKIFFVEYDDGLSKIMTVRVATSPEFEYGVPEVVTDMPTLSGYERKFGVSPDGERIVMLRAVNTVSGRIHFNVVLNWFEELGRLVPTP